ncbi:MAG: hypothetical protein M1820_002987 [Bogoriella megaspora]|nr:MAG: hypothetical protein M1820_002987 [Bogoriella megaspora]
MATPIQQNLVSSNKSYASSFDKGDLALPPAKKYLVELVTCMDARIDPAAAFGISLGDAHVIRNAGGSTKDALRSIIISEQLLGTQEVLLIKHTGCGMLTFSNDDARGLVGKNLGPQAGQEVQTLDFLPFSDLDEAVKRDIDFINKSPLVPDTVALSGWVYDVSNGKVRQVAPFSLNTAALTQFVIFTLLSTPPNFLWQEWLETTFPGYTPVPTASEDPSSDSREVKRIDTTPLGEAIEKTETATTDELKLHATRKNRLNVRNTGIKFALDQTLGAAFNTVAFIAGMGGLQGKSRDQIIEAVKDDTIPMMIAGYKLWPLVSIISFTLIPFKWRLAFGSLVGVGWGVFLSLAVGGK